MDWVKSKFNNYEPFIFRNGVWQKLEDVFVYWEGSTPPVENDWYVYTDSTNTVIKGLTAKFTNPSDPTSIVFDSTYGWGQNSYIIPNNVTDIASNAFGNYYDKGGSAAKSDIDRATPTNSCSIYFHDNMTLSRTNWSALINGYPPINKLRLPNSFTGINTDRQLYAICGNALENIISNDFTEIVIPPNMIVIHSSNFGSGSFGATKFPNLKKIKIMRKDSDTPIYFDNSAFSGTAMWGGNPESIADDFEIYFDFAESELSSKTYFDPSVPDTYLYSFKGVFNYLMGAGRVHFNQTIVNE